MSGKNVINYDNVILVKIFSKFQPLSLYQTLVMIIFSSKQENMETFKEVNLIGIFP